SAATGIYPLSLHDALPISFQSLADLEAGRPALFTRTLGADERTGRSSTAAAYLGDTWRLSQSWQVTFGVRGERSWFGDAPPYNEIGRAHSELQSRENLVCR